MSRPDRGRRPGGAGERPAGRAAFVAAAAALALLVACGSPASSQAVRPEAPIPGPAFAAGWAASGPSRTFTGQDLFNQIDGGAELFLEFGFARLRLQAYAKDKAELTLDAYEMESAAAALGVYLMKMGRETPYPEIGARNSSEEAQMTMVKGRYFVQVDNLGDEPAPRAEAVALANAFLAGVADETVRTPLELLPDEGRKAGTERLIRGPYALQPYFTFGEGDILSLGGRVFGALAAYRTPAGAEHTRLIVPYPDEAAATSALAHLQANLDPYLKVTAGRPDGFDFVDYQSKKGSVTRSGAVLDFRFGAGD